MTPSRIDTDPAKIEELLTRNVHEVVTKDELREKLMSGRKLRVKLGIDPTSPNIHLGRATQLWRLRMFQELGHQVVFLIGNFTAQVGDTSDKEAERQMLAEQEVQENLKTYLQQAFMIIDKDKTEVVYNADWLGKLTFGEISRMADAFSVAEMIQRENIAKRLDAGKRISLRELLYPLMQGYDSIAINADVELGGSDQLFNCLAGRTLQRAYGLTPQNVLTGKLIPGTDGRKMSSSWGNVITLLDAPQEKMGKLMSIADSLLPEYWEACTRLPMAQLAERQASGENPRDTKLAMAQHIVGLYHGAEAALQARESWLTQFSKKEIPADTPTLETAAGTSVAAVLVQLGWCASNSEVRRKLAEGAIHLGDDKITDIAAMIPAGKHLLKLGRRITWVQAG